MATLSPAEEETLKNTTDRTNRATWHEALSAASFHTWRRLCRGSVKANPRRLFQEDQGTDLLPGHQLEGIVHISDIITKSGSNGERRL